MLIMRLVTDLDETMAYASFATLHNKFLEYDFLSNAHLKRYSNSKHHPIQKCFEWATWNHFNAFWSVHPDWGLKPLIRSRATFLSFASQVSVQLGLQKQNNGISKKLTPAFIVVNIHKSVALWHLKVYYPYTDREKSISLQFC